MGDTIEVLAKDQENLMSELRNAKQRKNKTIEVVTGTQYGATYYMDYDSFRCFCDGLLKKYFTQVV